MKYFFKGLLRLLLMVLLFPILAPLMFIDMIFWVGGKDPMNTPITPIREWIGDRIFY